MYHPIKVFYIFFALDETYYKKKKSYIKKRTALKVVFIDLRFCETHQKSLNGTLTVLFQIKASFGVYFGTSLNPLVFRG